MIEVDEILLANFVMENVLKYQTYRYVVLAMTFEILKGESFLLRSYVLCLCI